MKHKKMVTMLKCLSTAIFLCITQFASSQLADSAARQSTIVALQKDSTRSNSGNANTKKADSTVVITERPEAMTISTMPPAEKNLQENNVREKILKDIQKNLDKKNSEIDSTIYNLDSRVGRLDSLLKTGNAKERIDKLVERVQILEEKQRALEQNELNIYEANYQSAIINLVSMDREIKPLYLFHATRDFFNALSETTNPMTYPDFKKGFDKYREYVNSIKDEGEVQKSVAEIVGASGFVLADVPLVGAYSELLFKSMEDYINSIGQKKRDMKVDAEKMFAVTLALSQFTSDKNQVESEWEGITESLEEMQIYYDTLLNKNARMMGIKREDIMAGFTRQTDADKRYLYLSELRQKAADYVVQMKKENPKDWKVNIYYQLIDVQSQKVRYGDLTYRITRHISRYDKLIAKYKNNKMIGDHVGKLEDKLHELKSSFDETFEPFQYVHAATQMYKVN